MPPPPPTRLPLMFCPGLPREVGRHEDGKEGPGAATQLNSPIHEWWMLPLKKHTRAYTRKCPPVYPFSFHDPPPPGPLHPGPTQRVLGPTSELQRPLRVAHRLSRG